MTRDPARVRQPPTRRKVLIVSLLIGGTWAFGATLPLGSDLSYPPAHLDAAYYERVVTGSILLATLALIAWLVVRLAPSRESIRITSWLVAIGAVTAALGNLLEDGLGITDASILYGIGLFGMLFGLIGLVIVLAVRRQALLAGLTVFTLAGFMSAFGHGPPLMPLIWFGFTAWVAVRGIPPSLVRTASSGQPLPDSPVT